MSLVCVQKRGKQVKETRRTASPYKVLFCLRVGIEDIKMADYGNKELAARVKEKKALRRLTLKGIHLMHL